MILSTTTSERQIGVNHFAPDFSSCGASKVSNIISVILNSDFENEQETNWVLRRSHDYDVILMEVLLMWAPGVLF